MYDFDVVVVGGGLAGLCAVTEVLDGGGTALLVEAESDVGGASRFSAGVVMAAGTRFQHERGVEDTVEALMHDYLAVNRFGVETAVARRLCADAGLSVEWVVERGARVVDLYFSGDDPVPRGHVIEGGGEALVDILRAIVANHPVSEIAVGQRIDRLLSNGDGVVVGVAAGADEVTAGAVVLATGGFGANRSLWPDLLPRAVRAEWSFYIGPPSSKGDIFELVAPYSAQVVGHDRGLINVRPHFSQSMDSYLPGWLVVVNTQGHRFVNEMTAYSVTETTVRQNGGRAWAIFDDATKQAAAPRLSASAKKYDMPTGSNWEDWVEPVIDEMTTKKIVARADTLGELAEALGIAPEGLLGSIQKYNEDVAAGQDTMFEKPSQVMRPVATAPFYGTELRCCNVSLTGAGPRINSFAQVLNRGALPIPGLYAAGECTGGVIGDVYVGSGNALANALAFGRVAGRYALADARSRKTEPAKTEL